MVLLACKSTECPDDCVALKMAKSLEKGEGFGICRADYYSTQVNEFEIHERSTSNQVNPVI